MIRNSLALLILVLFLGCRPDIDQTSVTHVSYYSCDNDAVIRISVENGMLATSLFHAKELIASRQLILDADKTGRFYRADDMTLRYDGEFVELKYGDRVYLACSESPLEMERRELATTTYYITDGGDLITAVIKDSAIVLELKRGSNSIYSGSLPRVVSASGEKYEESNTMFWAKGNTAMFVNDGIMYGHCIRMWPEEITADPCPNYDIQSKTDSVVRSYIGPDIEAISAEQRRYSYDATDLNADGNDEIFIAFTSPYFCGSGGCSWLLLRSDYSVMTKGTVSDYPFYISSTITAGYRDIYVQSDGIYHILRYDGSAYPGNPSTQPEIQLFSDPEYTTAGAKRVLEQAYMKQCEF